MLQLPVSDVEKDQRATAAYAAALLHALARDEAAGRRPVRLTEPGLSTWTRFKGRLAPADLVRLLFEDAAVLHRIPFDPGILSGDLKLHRLHDTVVHPWLQALTELELEAPGPDYIAAQARLLGLTTRFARSDLHRVQRHQRVLELPGTGGQLAHHLVSNQPELSLRDNFTIACDGWRELTMAGVVALDLAAPNTSFVSRTDIRGLRDPGHAVRKGRYDFVVGLAPSKGGLFQKKDQLEIWFHGATILLV